MCGIAGWFGSTVQADDAQVMLARMIAAIRHRGLDGEGTWLGSHAALGHTRLSIIDLAGGSQPMEARNAVVSFNGEIYNFRELRQELSGQGYRFHTQSDTEVILAIYHTWGWESFARMRGMYAFALWDKKRNRGWLIRDPLGIKPLFVAETTSGLLFGSEAKAILAHGAVRPEMDEVALHLVMNFRYLPGAYSMFRGIKQVPPGGVIQWQPEGILKTSLPHIQFPVQSVPDALQGSVHAHLTADVEVGTYLSGGLDSGVVAALARQYGLQRSFTLEVGDDPLEARNAAESARLLGLENISEAPGIDLEMRLSKLVRALEVPKINSLQVSQLAALAANHVKVTLSGLGGDELFYGYRAHQILNQASRLASWSPGWVTQILGSTASKLIARSQRLPWSEAERAALMLAGLGSWPRVYGLLRNLWDSPILRQQIYGPRMLDASLPNAFEVIEREWPADPDPVVAMARYERREKMVNDLLWQEDRVSMAEGLEVRTPFVDLPLTQAVSQHPRDMHMPNGQLKGYLREVASTLLPVEIINRPKSGFQVHAPSFFHQYLISIARELLCKERLQDNGLFNPEFVTQVLAAPPHTRYRWHYFILYLMLMTQIWMEEFLDGK